MRVRRVRVRIRVHDGRTKSDEGCTPITCTPAPPHPHCTDQLHPCCVYREGLVTTWQSQENQQIGKNHGITHVPLPQ
jgi:hypothetical protein